MYIFLLISFVVDWDLDSVPTEIVNTIWKYLGIGSDLQFVDLFCPPVTAF